MQKEVFELPVPIGGTIWDTDYPELPQEVMGYRIGRMMGEDMDDYYDAFELGIWYIQYGCCGIEVSSPVSEIGVSIFLTRDEMMAAIEN